MTGQNVPAAMNNVIPIMIHIAIHAAFLVLSACATTDMLRLTRLATAPVSDPACYCPVCGAKLRLRDQIPAVSWAVNRGKCRSCQSPIPLTDCLFEVLLFLFFSVLAAVTGYRKSGFLMVIASYELIKLLTILRYGRRADHFASNLMQSLLGNLINFALLGFLFLLAAL